MQIQQYMEQLLNRGAAVSDLAYLRVLQLVHIEVSHLIGDLKAYELPPVSSRSSDVNDTRRAVTSVGSAPTTTVSTMLETATEELFVPYTEGQRYLERESGSLGSLYSGLLANFTKYHVRL
jgi:exocyst complex component 5